MAHTIERPKLTEGRLPQPGPANEVVADITAARQFHLHAGSTIEVVAGTTQEELPNAAKDPHRLLHVVGVGVTRDNVVTANALANQPTLMAASDLGLGPDYYGFDGAYVVLRPGASISSFTDAAERLAARFPKTGGGVFVANEQDQAARVVSAIRPQAIALALFALLVAIVALVAIAQVLGRHVTIASADNPTLRALGMTRAQVFRIVMVMVVGLAALGAACAVAVAYVGSHWMPIGPARLAEPHPGLSFDTDALLLGALAIFVVICLVAIRPAWRAAALRMAADSDHASERRGSRLEAFTRRSGAPASAAIGVSNAIAPGRGRRAVPTWSAFAGVAVAVAAIVGALVFGANLSNFVGTPRLYGQAWDLTADAQFSALPSDALAHFLRTEPGVSAWTVGEHGDFRIDGQAVTAIGLDKRPTDLLTPTVLEGHAPDTTDQIALGTKTLAALHKHVGDSVDVVKVGLAPNAPATKMQIVGRSVFPFFGRGSFTPAGLGNGAQVLLNKPGELNPGQAPNNFVLLRVAPGPNHARTVAQIEHDITRQVCTLDNQCQVTAAARPVDVLNYARVQSTPIVLALVLAILAILVVAYLLLTSLQRRRHDFAILKTLGFTRGQVSAAVAVQATTVVVLALLIGIPAGLLLGHASWSVFATNLGVPIDFTIPTLGLLVTVAAAVVVANLIAAPPGIIAGRLQPAPLLRAD
jgi:ABC-type antimicrobial peptide transport system permease subunit